MNNLKKMFLTFMLIVLFIGCNSIVRKSNREYKRKNYVKSMILLMDAIDQKPNREKNYEIINERLITVVNNYLRDINYLISQKNDYNKSYGLATRYEALYKIQDRYDRLSNSIKSKIVYKSLLTNDLRKKAAESYYNAAVILEKRNIKKENKKVAKLYKKVLEFDSNFKDIKIKARKSKEKAMQKVIFKKINEKNYSGMEIGNLVYDSILSKIKNNKEAMEYTVFVNRNNLEEIMDEFKLKNSGLTKEKNEKNQELIGANLLIKVDITAIEYNRPDTIVSENYKTKTVKKLKDGVAYEEKIDYTEYRYRKETSATIIASYSILDIETGEIIQKGTKTGKANDYVTWKEVSNNFGSSQTEQNVKSKVEIIKDSIDNLSEKISLSLIDYLK